MKYFSKEVRIALVAITGVVILFVGMNFLKGKRVFSDDNIYHIVFDDISGLSASSPIFANGFKVGRVSAIDYDYSGKGDIIATAELNKELKVPNGSYAEIESDMLGNVKVNLVLGNRKNGFLEPEGRIPGSINAGTMGKAAGIIPQIQQLMPKIDTLLTNLNTITANPAIAQSLHNAQQISSDLTITTRELNTLMSQLNKELPGIVKRANTVLDNSGTLTANLASIDVSQTMAKVEETLLGIKQFSDKLNSNSGSLGLLLNDQSLYNNLNSTIANADSLMINLRENPKRYVHFSIFGRKNK